MSFVENTGLEGYVLGCAVTSEMILSCNSNGEISGTVPPFQLVRLYPGLGYDTGYQLAIGGVAGTFLATVELLVVPV
jgi:hypothetical protein